MSDIGIGIVGAGNWAIGRAQRFDRIDGCRVTIGWSRSAASRERFEREVDAPPTDDWQDVCRCDDVDAVLVATPHVFHFEQAREALACGKHVMVETPLCLEHDQAQELVALADGADLVVHHAAKWRYHPDHHQEIANLKAAGPLVHAEKTASFEGGPDRPWYRDFELSGGAFSFVPYMSVDFFQAFGPPAEVAGRHVRQGKLDVATLWVRFTDGGEAKITYATGEGVPSVDTGLVIGRDGIVEWGTGTPKCLRQGEAIPVELAERRELDVALVECQAFVDEIRGGRDFRPDLELDLAILKAVSQARQCAGG